MCGRFLLTAPLEAVGRAFAVAAPATNLAPRYNIAPTQAVCVVRLADEDVGTGTPEGGREMTVMRWGLVPPWMKEVPASRPLINARVETVAEKPSFRAAYRRRRCLVPADGWYEWQAREGKGPKQPYLIRPADSADRPFAFAGLWERWYGPKGEDWLESVTILTMPAYPALTELHHRMPVPLAAEDFPRWLAIEDPPAPEPLAKLALLPEERFEAVAISTRVNDVGHDDASVIAPAGPDQPRLL